MVREAGDSAVAEYRTSDEMKKEVESALADTVEYYNGELLTTAKVVIERDTIKIQDTLLVGRPEPEGDGTKLTQFPTYDRDGVVIDEWLRFDPPIKTRHRISRLLNVSFRPDTAAVALLREGGVGLDRFVASFNEEARQAGRTIRVIDAAIQKPDTKTALDDVWTISRALACTASGFALARELNPDEQTGTVNTVALLGGGSVCAFGVAIGF